ncbi:MAG: low molecular weight phosphotyrosine protein phosphatase [Ruminococcaceae bacterium]|nr:low molecular weight phosphotyrosine protein phosphatase [Oscillospiraceae bacterium]
MIKILFVCHGNICRSPMAEFLMKELVHESGCEDEFYIESAATSREEIGNGVYPPVKRILDARGIDCSQKRARQMIIADYQKFDYIICMDSYNLRNMERIVADRDRKYKKLLDFTDTPHDVADPWYTGDFDTTEKEIEAGCKGLFEFIKKQM